MKKFLRSASVLLVLCLILPLSACFDPNYKWDLPERKNPDFDWSLLSALTGTEPPTEPPIEPPIEPPEVIGDELNFVLSADGGHYVVAGAADKAAVRLEIPDIYNGIPVTEIADSAFSGMNKLESISIPDSITRVGGKAFSGCAALEYAGINGFKYLGNDSNPYRVLIACGNEAASPYLVINDATAVIADEACINAPGVEYVYIPASVVTVGDYAFWACTTLREAEIGHNVNYIGDGAFYGCSALESVSIPDGVTYLGSDAFFDCSSLVKAVIGNGIETLNPNTFGRCTSLTTVDLGDNLRHIDQAAFDSCTSLAGITLPMSLGYIHKDAFSSCPSLKYTEFNGGCYLKFDGGDKLCLMAVRDENAKTLGIHYYTGVVAYGLLGSLRSLETLEIRSKNNYEADDFGQYFRVMDNCLYHGVLYRGENSIVAGTNNSKMDTLYAGATSISDYAFYGCDLKEEIRLPRNLVSVGNYAFFGCTGVESVILNSSLEAVGEYAFGECTSLRRLTLNNNLKSIGEGAFLNCTNLSNALILPDSLTHIGTHAFESCIRLPSIELNDGIEYLGGGILNFCDDDIKVTYRGTKASWSRIAARPLSVSRSIGVQCTDGVVW